MKDIEIDLKLEIVALARQNGVDEIRFADAEALEPKDQYVGRQPRDFLGQAHSIIVCSVYIGAFYLPEWAGTSHARTSRLTLSGYYDNVVEPLVPIRDLLAAEGYKAVISDGSTGEGYIPLKPVAVKAGLGWTGKNTLLLNEKYGSWQALGAIITDADLAETCMPARNRCGSCSRCIDACPLRALDRPYTLRREYCLSDLLENESIPECVLDASGGFVFECDICQNACPWNTKHLSNPLQTMVGKPFDNKYELAKALSFEELMRMDRNAYDSSISEILPGIQLSYENFKRNLAAAYRNGHEKFGKNNLDI